MDAIEVEVDVRADGTGHRVDVEVANYRSDDVVVRLGHPLPDGCDPSAVSPLSGSLGDSWSVSGDGLEFVREVEWASAIQTGYTVAGVDAATIEDLFGRSAVEVRTADGSEVGTVTGLEPQFADDVSPPSTAAPTPDDAGGGDGDDGDPDREAAASGGTDAGLEGTATGAGRSGAGTDGHDDPFEQGMDGSDHPGNGADSRETADVPAGETGSPEGAALDAGDGSAGVREGLLPTNVTAYVHESLPEDLPESEFSWTGLDDRESERGESTRESERGESTRESEREESTRESERGESTRESERGESTREESGGLLERVRSWF
jgi:hypothetical protein